MHRRLVALLALALGCVATSAPAAQPLHGTAGSTESLTLMGAQYSPPGPAATAVWDGHFGIHVTSSATVTTAGVTPHFDAKASGYWWVCDTGYVSCVTVSIPQQVVSPTAFFADPLGNSVRVTAQVYDVANAIHTIDLTLTRPTSPSHPNIGTPNVWVDPATETVHGDTWLAFYRSGYRVAGTIDAFPFTPMQSGCQVNCGSSMANYGRYVAAGLTVND